MTKAILTVDDSPSLRMVLREALTGAGHKVVEAEDGLAALEWLETHQPQLVITDITMPRLDGLALIERLRSREAMRDLPILVLTTESAPASKARARAAGATGWIAKPFDPEKLNSAIRRVIH
jgi:two-component system chemotaxis response regulator CheY